MSRAIDETHDPELRSWIESANDPETDFPIQNLPLGVFYDAGDDEDETDGRVGIAIGDQILDLDACAQEGLFDELDEELYAGDEDEEESFESDVEDPLLSLLAASGMEKWGAIRRRASELLREGNDELAGKKKLRKRCLVPMERAGYCTPGGTGDYTDFYASVHHATNVGSMFRPDNPLLPNYRHMPIAYHGRASTLVPTGRAVRRPCGQTCEKPGETDPVYGPCRLLDYEVEVGVYMGPGNDLGHRIPIERAEEHVMGLCLVNDWSARDLQKWEYQPLGPFLAKSFATTVSPWIVTLEALAPFRVPAFERPAGDPRPLPHLDSEQNRASGGIDLTVEAWLRTEKMRASGEAAVRLSRGSFREMYWTIGQMIAHHASNGCELAPGDLLASGTVSGPERENRGCLLELTWDGDPWAEPARPASGAERTPIKLPNGEERTFLQDGDEVIIRGSCEREGYRRIGFGECSAAVEPAWDG